MLLGRLSKVRLAGFAALLFGLQVALAPGGLAQGYPPPPPPPGAAAFAEAPVFSRPQLDQLLAPIALYPDALLAQVLMAATYPLDVIAADRWVREPYNAQLRGDTLAYALEREPWDPSVKSLVPFPQVLAMMASRLDWLQRLGDAFLVQPSDVMATVQRLRRAAQAAGYLASTSQETVEYQDGTIIIVPANPNFVYVPYYNPNVVYGPWYYPNYPPVYLAPPRGYGISGFFFGLGVSIVAPLWGWGDVDWHHHVIRIDRNRFNRINRGRRPMIGDTWRFDPSRRGAVPYGDARTRAQYQRPLPGPMPSRDFRGYAPAPRAARPVSQPRLQTMPPQPQRRARPEAQPQFARPATSPAQQAVRPPERPAQIARPGAPSPAQQAGRPPRRSAQPVPAARPGVPQAGRRAAPTSAFQPSSGANVRAYERRGAQSRAAPVARSKPHPAPTSHPARSRRSGTQR